MTDLALFHMSSSPLRDTRWVQLPNKALLCAPVVSHSPEPLLQSAGQRACSVGTPSSLTPADLPLDERDLRPAGSPDPSISSRQKQLFKLVAWTPVSESGRASQDYVGLLGSHYWICEKGKVRQRCWQLWYVLRGTGLVLSLTELCKNGSVETFAWYRCWASASFCTGGTHTQRAHTHIHTEAQIKQILPSGTSNYPQ